jgi:energy-coupling factor transport system ATP-binding protein
MPDTRASGALLSVRDLGIRHDGADAEAPAGASFVVNRGEVVLLLGPSGAGKSTLALALNGLVPHAVPATVRGRVEVDGLDTAETPVSVLSTRVGMVFQDPDAQLVTGTLLDEVAFGPENLRLPVADVLERAEEALRRVGLWDRRHENPDRLSGGGRQRLAIACALAMGSPLLVLDEPTANLDPQGVEEVYATLGALVAAGDRAIVLVEHNLDAVVGIVDRVVVLDRTGRTVADGTVDEVLRARAPSCMRWVSGCPSRPSPHCVCAPRDGRSILCRSTRPNCAPPSTRRTHRPARPRHPSLPQPMWRRSPPQSR